MIQLKHKIAVVIPTMNRPGCLMRLLQSLYCQTVPVDQIIIVDGSNRSIKPEIEERLLPNTDYIRHFPPSLLLQKEAGTRAIKEDITLVGYLDDDIVVEEDAVEVMLRFWEHCPDDIGGASFNITNRPIGKVSLFGKLYLKLFYLHNSRQGVILRSGSNPVVSPVLKDTYVEWLSGGVTVWRREVQETIEHDNWWHNHSYGEDVDFGLRVSKKWKLVILRDARVQHLTNPPVFSYAKGKEKTIERHHLVKNHTELSAPIFYWSMIGKIGGLIYGGIRIRSLSNILMALGHIVGLLNIWIRRTKGGLKL